ncbi:MAG: zinc ribbon domain-containing protein [Chitinophagaceae bacterium]|nr:zinc ribbon domain-containing protein [Chitinophagaceae bacterium]
MSTYKNCQSCSMPLDKDPGGGGTNADGSKSDKYCSYCYANGEFVAKDMTVTEMQEYVKKKLQSMGFPGFLAGMLTKGMPKLERWQK